MSQLTNQAQNTPELVDQPDPFECALQTPRIDWDQRLYEDFGESFALARHNYHELDLFQQDALIDLLDKHPRRRLQCFTMGQDPTRPDEWRAVCIRDASASDLFEALAHGRIWINVSNVDHTDWRYYRMIEDMYQRVDEQSPLTCQPELYYNTLTLASPGTQFYFHISPENNMIWNMLGEATVSMLPAMDFRFVSQEHLEEIFAREASGAIEYQHDFAEFESHKSIAAGECIWWPMTAPIRVQYRSLCASLWTSYFCPIRARRDTVQLANRYLLREFGVESRSIKESGVRSGIKRLAFKAINKVRPFEKEYDFTDNYLTNLRLNLDAPDCIESVDETLTPEFSKLAQNAQN